MVKKRMDEWEKNEQKISRMREVKGSDEEQKHGLGEEEERERERRRGEKLVCEAEVGNWRPPEWDDT